MVELDIEEVYKRVKNTLKWLMCLSLSSRAFTAVFISFEVAYEASRNVGIPLGFVLIFILELIEKKSIFAKKLTLYMIFELLHLFYKKGSGMSGLGLYISDSILKLLNSSLKVSSQLGQGSIFSFCLDILENYPGYEFSNENEIPLEIINIIQLPRFSLNCFEKECPKIMIVDDNDFNRMLLGNILKKYGVNYIEAINGKIAVKKALELDKRNTPLSCIIMDINMPEMDGWEASKLINKMFTQGYIKFLPDIIGHTAYSSVSDLQQCFDSGMISYILKPTSQEHILSIISKYF